MVKLSDVFRIAGYNRNDDIMRLKGFSATKATDNRNNSASFDVKDGDEPARGQEFLLRDETQGSVATLYPIAGSTPTSQITSNYRGLMLEVLSDVRVSQIGIKTDSAATTVYFWKVASGDYTLETELLSGTPTYSGGYSSLTLTDDLRLGPGFYAIIAKGTALGVGYYAGFWSGTDSYAEGKHLYYYDSSSAPAHGLSMLYSPGVGASASFPPRGIFVYYPLTVNYRYFCGIVDQVQQDPRDRDSDYWHVSCRDYTYSLDKKLVQEIYTNTKVDEIVLDLIAKYADEFTTTNVQTNGPQVERKVFDYKHMSDCLTALAEYVGWSWYIDSAKDLHFFEPDTASATAPETITASNCNKFKYQLDSQELRNRVYVKGAYYLSDEYTHEIVADGLAKAWTMPYPPKELTLEVGGILQTVGQENIDNEDDYDYMYNTTEKTVRMSDHDTAPSPYPAAGVTMAFKFKFDLPVIAMKEDETSQQAIAAAEGGDGIYEHIIVDESLNSNRDAEMRAEEDLRQYSNPKVKGSFETYTRGFEPGQVVYINISSRGIDNYFVVQRVSQRVEGKTWKYTVEFGGRIKGLEDVFKAILSAKKDSKDKDAAYVQKFKTMTGGTFSITSASSYLIRTPKYYKMGDADAIMGFTAVNSS